MSIIWKFVEERHVAKAHGLKGEERDRYIVALVEKWSFEAKVGDFESLSRDQLREVKAAFGEKFEGKETPGDSKAQNAEVSPSTAS